MSLITRGETRNVQVTQNFWWNIIMKRPFRRPGRRCEDNIKTNFGDTAANV